MTIVICQKHGGEVGAMVCCHISQRVSQKEPVYDAALVQAREVTALEYFYSLVCSECLKKVQPVMDAEGQLDEAEYYRLVDALLEDVGSAPVCKSCLTELREMAKQHRAV